MSGHTPTVKRKSSVEFYLMPDGTSTNDHTHYVKVWRLLAVGIEKMLGWKLSAFDPGLRFRKPNGICEDVPIEIATLVNTLFSGGFGK